MIIKTLLPIASTLALSKGVLGWGDLGHETVGFVAMSFLAPKALSFVQSTIPSSDDNSLGPAAPWADSVREESSFKFTAPFHFLDAEDDPLGGTCDVVPSRDCGSSGCILTAIANYTQRVVDTKLSSTQRQQALMFIDHFLGDIGQPLHVEAIETGGNDIDAICGGDKTNLHATWDTGMIETFLDANFSGSSENWATSLVKEIQSGDFKSLTSNWISCSSTSELASKRSAVSLEDDILGFLGARSSSSSSKNQTFLECPLVWAQEANTFDCTDVFDFVTGQDLCTGSYYENAIPIIKLQLAKQGYRLAAWLNVLFDGSTNLP